MLSTVHHLNLLMDLILTRYGTKTMQSFFIIPLLRDLNLKLLCICIKTTLIYQKYFRHNLNLWNRKKFSYLFYISTYVREYIWNLAKNIFIYIFDISFFPFLCFSDIMEHLNSKTCISIEYISLRVIFNVRKSLFVKINPYM